VQQLAYERKPDLGPVRVGSLRVHSLPRPGWFVGARGDGTMKHLNVAAFYELGIVEEWLDEVAGRDPITNLAKLAIGAETIEKLLRGDVIRHSRRAAQGLLDAIKAIEHGGTPDLPPGWDMFQLKHALQNFDLNFREELAAAPVFFLTRKSGYDTDVLLCEAELLLSDRVQAALSTESKADIREAGRCIALRIPTAAVFHILRVTERFLRMYYAVVTRNQPAPKSRDWGAYLRVLKTCPDMDMDIWTDLDRIRDKYRNPIIHPEDTVEFDDVLPLFDRAKSVIHSIVLDVDRIWK